MCIAKPTGQSYDDRSKAGLETVSVIGRRDTEKKDTICRNSSGKSWEVAGRKEEEENKNTKIIKKEERLISLVPR
jgi:hypothetical protein